MDHALPGKAGKRLAAHLELDIDGRWNGDSVDCRDDDDSGSPSKYQWRKKKSLTGALARWLSPRHGRDGYTYSRVSNGNASPSFEHSSSAHNRRRLGFLIVSFTATVAFVYGAGYHSGVAQGLARAGANNASFAQRDHVKRPSAMPNSIFTTFRDGRTYPRAFVCITGQLPRLELANKINHLFRPWHENYGVEFDVALVLTDTNHASVIRVGQRDQSFFSVREVFDELSSVPGVRVLNADIDVQNQKPLLNPYYARQRGENSSMNSTQLLERVQNHVRQFESLSRCHYYMSADGMEKSYDIVHRVRDDSGYFAKPNFDHLYNLTMSHPMTIVSSDCEFHKGINDRGSFVSPEAAYDYFNHPIMHMYTKALPLDVRNTEQFLMVSYARTCHLVQTDSFHLFRLWNKNGTAVFSNSDIKCIERNGIGASNRKKVHTRKRFCHTYSDGNDYCVHYDKAGLTYFPEGGLELPEGVDTVAQEDGAVWDYKAAKEVAIAGGVYVVNDDDGLPSIKDAGGTSQESTEDGDDVDDDITFVIDESDDNIYHTLDSGDLVDKITAKKIARQKKRKEARENKLDGNRG